MPTSFLRSRIWLAIALVVVSVVVPTGFAAVITLTRPAAYAAVARFSVEQAQSSAISGAPQARQQRTADWYVELVNNPSFKQEVARAVRSNSFAIEAQPVERTNFFVVNTEAGDKRLAKKAALAALAVLLKKSKESETQTTEILRKRVQTELVDPAAVEKTRLFKEIEYLRFDLETTGLPRDQIIEKKAKIDDLQDQIGALRSARQAYNDILIRSTLGDVFSKGEDNELKLVFPVTVLTKSPLSALQRNVTIAFLVGLISAITLLMVVEQLGRWYFESRPPDAADSD